MPAARLAQIIVLLGLLGSVPHARGEVSRNESRVWRRARLIAPGQQVWGFESAYRKFDNQFSALGEVQPLGNRYARAVTWRQLLENSNEGRPEVEAYMRDRKLSSNDVAATATYSLERTETSFTVDWAYGLTARWMIGFQVPLTYRQTRISSNVELTPTLAQGASEKALQTLSRDGVKARVRQMAESELQTSGYDSIPEQKNSWDFGDISLLSQFSLLESYRWTWSLQQMVRVPTARNPSVGDYLQTNTDEGQVDVGLTSLVDYRRRSWLAGMRFGYVAQLPDNARMRVTSERYQVDPSVHRDLGDWIWGALDGEYRVTRRLGLNLEYAFLSKTADRYSGGSTPTESVLYEQLARDTDQELHQTRLGFVYRLGGATARSGVENKWVASAGFTYPWIGRNSADASRTSLELINYF